MSMGGGEKLMKGWGMGQKNDLKVVRAKNWFRSWLNNQGFKKSLK